MDDGNSNKKVKGTKKCVIKRVLKFNDYEYYLLNNQIILKSQLTFKSDRHDLYSQRVNKIALGSNGNKRLQTFDRMKSCPFGASVGKVCKIELIKNRLILIIIHMKIKQSTIQSGHIFQIIHTEY